MALALSLPPLEARPANPPETRPARVQPWLEDTLKRDPVEAAGVIGDALAATNRVALSESRRLELAERYYGTALTLWPNLERYFAHAQLGRVGVLVQRREGLFPEPTDVRKYGPSRSWSPMAPRARSGHRRSMAPALSVG